MMQGYDLEEAVPFIARAMRKAGHRLPQPELESFIRRAIDADMDYMHACGALDDEGLMGEGEYDEDDAFEALLDALADDPEDDAAMDALAQLLDSYMEAQQDFLDQSGLTQA